jgi:hypothetical protein
MPAVDPQALAALLRQQNTMLGQGAVSDKERAYMNMMNAQMPNTSPMAGQGAISDAEQARAQQAMQNMQGMQGLGQGMGGMSEADRKFLMMQQGQ